MPDGLWLYAFTAANIIIWEGDKKLSSFLWKVSVPALAFVSEVLQGFGVLSGTFDTKDLVAYLFSSFAIFTFFNNPFHNLVLRSNPNRALETSCQAKP